MISQFVTKVHQGHIACMVKLYLDATFSLFLERGAREHDEKLSQLEICKTRKSDITRNTRVNEVKMKA